MLRECFSGVILRLVRSLAMLRMKPTSLSLTVPNKRRFAANIDIKSCYRYLHSFAVLFCGVTTASVALKCRHTAIGTIDVGDKLSRLAN